MPTKLLTQDVLNVEVSCFANYDTPANPVTIKLSLWLRSEKHRAKVDALRLVTDKTKRDAIKATLPAITPSGVFNYRKEADLVPGSHTRLIQFDIDPKDNPKIRNYADLKAQISRLPFVAYCALSASGLGYWGLVPIADPERHGQHFDALKRVFAHYKINIDTKPRNVASLRGYSYDAAPYQPESVMLFELYDVPPQPKPRPFALTTDADTEQVRVEVCINEVARRGICIGENYADWYAVGCSLANSFGESGRDYYHQVSQHYPGYQYAQTDKQFTACLRANSKATLGTFFLLCQQAGIEWKELVPVSVLSAASKPRTPRPNVSTATRPARPQLILNGETIYGEVLAVEPCDHYPPEWDCNRYTGAGEPSPNVPDVNPGPDVPTTRPLTFFEWQRQHPAFSQMGLASLTRGK